MTILTGHLQRHVDVSKVSGTGAVAEFAEFTDGAVAVRWLGDRPSTAAWGDMRHVEYTHGHQGATEIVFDQKDGLLKAYQELVPLLLQVSTRWRPITAAEHPDHPGVLRLTFDSQESWDVWIRRIGGLSEQATHEEVNGEVAHRWVSPYGLLWLEWFESPARTTETDLQIFDREDR